MTFSETNQLLIEVPVAMNIFGSPFLYLPSKLVVCVWNTLTASYNPLRVDLISEISRKSLKPKDIEESG